MGKIKNENYTTIQGWMINDLGLSGNELIAYAVIYGFSQADGQYMTCSQEYISNWCNLSRESTNKLLARLVKKGLVIKKLAKQKGSVKYYEYKAVTHVTSDETSHVTSDETSHVTSDETSHNNKYNKYKKYNNTATTNKFKNFHQRERSQREINELEKMLLTTPVKN